MCQIKYPSSIYPKEVLIKAAFRFIDRAYIHIDCENDEFIVSITPKDQETEIKSGDFDNEMILQAARYTILMQTKTIREITLGRAMASTIIEKRVMDESNEIELDMDQFDADSILKDWFENE